MIQVIATIELKPGCRDDFLPLLNENEPVDQLPGYCNPGGDGGKVIGGKPAGITNFGGVGFNFTAGIVR